jgi:hypothetical protein
MNLPTWVSAIRIVHITFGMVALFVAPAAMLTVKGGQPHRRWGKIYFWSMAVVAVTAIVLAFWRPVIFLAFVAVFSFYFSFSGYRSLIIKRSVPGAIDWIAVALMILGGIGLLTMGLLHSANLPLPAPIVSIVFGIAGITTGLQDLYRFLKPPTDKNWWWFTHMSGMLASYIATLTAFSATNFRFLPTAVAWLWPTVIGVPVISVWVRYYRRRFRRKEARHMMEGMTGAA